MEKLLKAPLERFAVRCLMPRTLVIGAEVLGVDIPLGSWEWRRAMEPGLVFYGAEDLVDWSVEDWSFYLAGVDREGLLVVELRVLPEASLVLVLPRSSGVCLTFLRSLGLLLVDVPCFL